MTTVVTPDRKDRFLYRVCTQVNSDSDLVIRTLCLPDDDAMKSVLTHITGHPLERLNFVEVHRHDRNSNNVAVVIESDKPFPTKVKIRTYDMSVRLKTDSEEETRKVINEFFERNVPQVANNQPVPALPPPERLATPGTIPLKRYTLKVA